MGKTLAIADVRREIQKAITKLRILPSATIAVLPGDHPMRPSVITAEGSEVVTGPADPPGGTFQRIPKWSGVGNALVDSAFEHLTVTNPPDLENVHEFRTLPDSPFNMRLQPGIAGGAAAGQALLLYGGQASLSGIDEDGGQVRLRGGLPVGGGNLGNVNILGTQIIFSGEIVIANNTSTTGSEGSGTAMTSSVDTEIHFDVQSTELFRIEAAQVTVQTDLDMNGNDIINVEDIAGVIDTGLTISAGDASASGAGSLALFAGNGFGVSGGGSIAMLAGASTFGGQASGSISLTCVGHGSGLAGNIVMTVGAGDSGFNGEILMRAWNFTEALRVTADDPPLIDIGVPLNMNDNRILGTAVTYGAGFDGGGSTIAAGTEIEVRVEQGFTITAWYIIADQTGDIQIDIWRDTFANHPPTVADTITGGNEPAISSDDQGSDLVLAGWDTTVNEGDILKFVVDSAIGITRMSIYLIGTRT